MHTVVFFDELSVNISDDDWDYLCKNRLFTDTPDDEDLRIEFVTGTGITPNKRHLWNQADKMFADYIDDLKIVQSLDINKMARDVLSIEEKLGKTNVFTKSNDSR